MRRLYTPSLRTRLERSTSYHVLVPTAPRDATGGPTAAGALSHVTPVSVQLASEVAENTPPVSDAPTLNSRSFAVATVRAPMPVTENFISPCSLGAESIESDELVP